MEITKRPACIYVLSDVTVELSSQHAGITTRWRSCFLICHTYHEDRIYYSICFVWNQSFFSPPNDKIRKATVSVVSCSRLVHVLLDMNYGRGVKENVGYAATLYSNKELTILSLKRRFVSIVHLIVMACFAARCTWKSGVSKQRCDLDHCEIWNFEMLMRRLVRSNCDVMDMMPMLMGSHFSNEGSTPPGQWCFSAIKKIVD